ncbi:MAG: LPS export ABC transporter periplasmic protein LptC [Mariprofundales bacterium]
MFFIWQAGDANDLASANNELLDTKAASSIQGAHLVERTIEGDSWRLSAQNIKQSLDGAMQLAQPLLELGSAAKEMIPVKANTATYDPDTQMVRFHGHAEVHFKQWTVRAEEMFYDGRNDEILIPGDFSLISLTLNGKGKNMRIQRETQQLYINNGVWLRDSDPNRWSFKQ